MLEEDKNRLDVESEEEEDDDEGREFKTISIADAVKLRKAERDRRNKEFHEKLDKLKARTAELKKDYEEKRKR